MSWRTIVITKSSKLDYNMGFLVVRGESTIKIHIDEIHTLILETTAISLTAALLCELMKNKVKVIFCDEKRNPSSELIPYYGAHDSSAKVKNQIAWLDDAKTSVWTAIVSEKIKQQAVLLEELNLKEAEMLYKYREEIRYGDETNREGHAAKVYFNALFGLSFTRSEESSINAALNYGYSIILSVFNREIVASGYLTQIGIFHDNMFNHFNLGSDLMEPFRPVVDRLVKIMNPEKFEVEQKHRMLDIFREEVNIGGRQELLLNAIKIYVKSVFDALNENDISLLKFYQYEL